MATDEASVDVRTYRAFYRDHFTAVCGLAISLTGDRDAGEDVAQEAFARAYREWDRVSHYDNPGAWVRRVASNLAVSRWRRVRSESRALLRLGNRRTSPVELPELDDEFWAQVRALPDQQARAVALFYVEDLSVAEVAEVLGCAEGTAKSHLHRARQTLAQRLGLDASSEEASR